MKVGIMLMFSFVSCYRRQHLQQFFKTTKPIGHVGSKGSYHATNLALFAEKRKIEKPKDWKIKKLQNSMVERNGKKKTTTVIVTPEVIGDLRKGLVIERHGDRLIVEPIIEPTMSAIENSSSTNSNISTIGNTLFTCSQKTSLAQAKIAVGDVVYYKTIVENDSTGLVISMDERRNVLERPTTGSNENKLVMKTIATNIDQFILVVSSQPFVPLAALDKFIVAAHSYNIPELLIVINKCDLEETTELREVMTIYDKLNYPILLTSIINNVGIDELKLKLINKTSIFVGQSGVGKSSLLNLILPEVQAKVGELVTKANIGAHTTSNAKLYHLPTGGVIIDSPGIRELATWHLSSTEIRAGFVEIDPLINKCKFSNCKHSLAEGENCAIRRAVQDGVVSKERYLSFLNVMNIE